MCYSAQASFLTAATLTPIGLYCLNSAFRRHRSLWPVATVPIVFGIQQAMEGVIWTSLNHQNPSLAESAAKVYLFFAICWWPFWGPLSALVSNWQHWWKSRFLTMLLIASSFWFFWFYLPALADFQRITQVSVVHHSIRYHYVDSVVLDDDHRMPITFLYLLFTAVPFLMQDIGKRSLIPISAAFVSVLTGNIFATYAYTSVWCIMAALLSSYCLIYFRNLDRSYFHIKNTP